jgi:hypothetical protein
MAARLADELINAGKPEHERGIWEPAEGGWLIHDFEDYEPVSSSAAAPVPSKSEAGRIGGIRSAEVRRERGGSAQPRSTEVVSGPSEGHEFASEAPSKQTGSASEADPEAAPKQNGFASGPELGFPPHPLSS